MQDVFEQFVKTDSYPILVELLTHAKERDQALNKNVKRINCVFNLLDAHVYAKCGDINFESKSLLAFI